MLAQVLIFQWLRGSLLIQGFLCFCNYKEEGYVCGTNFRDVFNRAVSYINIIVSILLLY